MGTPTTLKSPEFRGSPPDSRAKTASYDPEVLKRKISSPARRETLFLKPALPKQDFLTVEGHDDV